MPRYLVEQSFPEEQPISNNAEDIELPLEIGCTDALSGVIWVHSYVTPDNRRAFHICDAPTPEAIRRDAQQKGLSINRITEIRTVDVHLHNQ